MTMMRIDLDTSKRVFQRRGVDETETPARRASCGAAKWKSFWRGWRRRGSGSKRAGHHWGGVLRAQSRVWLLAGYRLSALPTRRVRLAAAPLAAR
jgi:hypothetical protein